MARLILALFIAAFVGQAFPRVVKRQANCKQENLFVGGTTAGEGYINEVKSLDDCVAKCKEIESCVAVNYFPHHEACLPQSDTKETDPTIESREEEGTVYVIVKGCNETSASRVVKREANACRQDNVFVGGTAVNDYINDVKSLEDCVAKCNEVAECKAVNYFPLHEACLPQSDTLKSDPSIQSRDEENTIYVNVKECDGGADEGDDEGATTEATPDQPENPESEQSEARIVKREANCKQDNLFVGGTAVDGYINDVASLEDCIAKCNALDACVAVNYFTHHLACLPQSDTKETDPTIESREEEGAVYVKVKGCQ